jgi:transposase
VGQEHDVRATRIWKAVLGVEHTVIETMDLEMDPGGQLVVLAGVRPTRRAASRCPRCGRRCPGYDRGDGRRRWRGQDLGSVRVFLEADAPRVSCAAHGVIVAALPWARHGAWFTIGFEDTVAWLAAHTTKTTVEDLMRTSWRSVNAIVTRVTDQARGKTDRLSGLRRIGIDEVSYRKGQRYIMPVVDHDTGRVVWVGQGRNQDCVRAFFDALGPDRTTQLTHVSADGAEWIHDVITERAPQAVICLDSFHVVMWATEAIDKVRRRITADLRAAGHPDDAVALKGSRWALLKNPENLTGTQRTTIASIKKTNDPLYRAYLIKEQLREVFHLKGDPGRRLLTGVIAWASRSRIPEMVALAKTLRRFKPLIANTLEHQLTNARSEATNTHIRVLTRQAYGFHSAQALIAMIELTRGGLCPPLPGRTTTA